jgi:hypothetical protein
MKKIICFDLDNVICKTNKSDYHSSKPIKKNINFIKGLYKKGFIVKIFTSRYMGRNNENFIKAKKSGYKFTLRQLKSWKVPFHSLIFGKPSYDFIIDDKSLHFKKNWIKDLKKKLIYKN